MSALITKYNPFLWQETDLCGEIVDAFTVDWPVAMLRITSIYEYSRREALAIEQVLRDNPGTPYDLSLTRETPDTAVVVKTARITYYEC